MFSAKVEGTALVVKMLKEYRGKKANGAIRKGSRAGCKIIQARAKRLIPRVKRRDRLGNITQGELRQAVKVRAIKRNRKGWIGSEVIIAGGGFSFSGDQFYGAFVEFGTRNMQARHYMKQAADESADAAKAVAIGKIKQEMER